MRACVIHSVNIGSSDAAAELIAHAKTSLGASVPRVMKLFTRIDHTFANVMEQTHGGSHGGDT